MSFETAQRWKEIYKSAGKEGAKACLDAIRLEVAAGNGEVCLRTVTKLNIYESWSEEEIETLVLEAAKELGNGVSTVDTPRVKVLQAEVLAGKARVDELEKRSPEIEKHSREYDEYSSSRRKILDSLQDKMKVAFRLKEKTVSFLNKEVELGAEKSLDKLFAEASAIGDRLDSIIDEADKLKTDVERG